MSDKTKNKKLKELERKRKNIRVKEIAEICEKRDDIHHVLNFFFDASIF
ncbi:MAG: hypothetical protein LBR43_03285 [Spiroplasmataceae bacterium]|nr:hypothetical protein [Spiroplasmataceae bacterium]